MRNTLFPGPSPASPVTVASYMSSLSLGSLFCEQGIVIPAPHGYGGERTYTFKPDTLLELLNLSN